MSAMLIETGLTLLAVAAVVGIVHWAGFSRPARLRSEAEAREWARFAPGGFTAERVALADDGRAALLADSTGDVLLLRPLGARFVSVSVEKGAIGVDQQSLRLALPDGTFSFNINGKMADWAEICPKS